MLKHSLGLLIRVTIQAIQGLQYLLQSKLIVWWGSEMKD